MSADYFTHMRETFGNRPPGRTFYLADWERTPAFIDRWVIFDSDLSAHAKLLHTFLRVVADNVNHGGDVYNIRESAEIADHLGLPEADVLAAANELLARGLLQVTAK